RKLPHHINHLKSRGINTYTLSGNIDFDMKVDSIQKRLEISLFNEDENKDIRYTTDGTSPTRYSSKYSGSLMVFDSLNLVAASFQNDSIEGRMLKQSFYYHQAIGKKKYNLFKE